METNGSQNVWFGTLHKEGGKKEEAVEVVSKTIGHIVTEEDLVNNPEFIEEGVVAGDTIEIHIESESAPQMVITPKPVKVRKVRASKKK